MKSTFLTAAAYLLAESAHAQVSDPPRHLREAADSEFGAVSSMSFSMTTNIESFVIASSSSGGRGGGSKSGKSAKAGKSVKSTKKDDKSLIALLAPAYVWAGPQPSGTLSVNYNPDGSFLLSLDAAGLHPDGGYVAFSSGTSCSNVFQPYYDDSSVPDPWFDENGSPLIRYTASEEGFSNSAWRINNGFGSQENDGHAFVVTGFNIGPSGCGVLGVAGNRMRLAAEMDMYPGYTGSHVVTGDVRVTYRKDSTFNFRYNLEGLEADCKGCGIHIHAGTSCDSHELVKGHGWNSEVVQDLWTADGGATYDSDAEGNAEGYFNLYNGYSFGKNVGHAVVVHAQSGERVSCGVLEGVVYESDMGNL